MVCVSVCDTCIDTVCLVSVYVRVYSVWCMCVVYTCMMDVVYTHTRVRMVCLTCVWCTCV